LLDRHDDDARFFTLDRDTASNVRETNEQRADSFRHRPDLNMVWRNLRPFHAILNR